MCTTYNNAPIICNSVSVSSAQNINCTRISNNAIEMDILSNLEIQLETSFNQLKDPFQHNLWLQSDYYN